MSQPPQPGLELPEPSAPGEPFLLLHAGGRRLGVPLPEVREVITARPYTRLPGAPAAVEGLINLRGRLVTVIDLAAALGASPAPVERARVVVVDHRGKQIGLAVDDVSRIVMVDPTTGEPVEEADGHEFQVLDTAALLGPALA